MRLRYFIALGLLAACQKTPSNTAQIAVATNFYSAAQALEAEFEAQTNYDVTLSFGSTGLHYAQITQGAPFDVFLAADQFRPAQLMDEGHAVSTVTYAQGVLVLWNGDRETLADSLPISGFNTLALANPALAPYGQAAQQAIESSGFSVKKKIIGENVGQAYSFVATGHTEWGFVALSQVLGRTENYMPVAESLYDPILQDAALLASGTDNEAAAAFYKFLQSDRAKAIIRDKGYVL